MTRPYDQNGCGACWAFSAAAATESLAIISGYDSQLTEYSVQQLVDCDTENYACGGGWMYEGFEYISKHGLLKRDDYFQFSSHRNKCRISDEDLIKKEHIKDIGYVEHDGRDN